MLKNRHLLYLEDDEDIAENTKVLFDVFVGKVYHVSTREAAESILSNTKIDFIISDIKLKNENALDFITSLRENNPSIPIVIISGYKKEEYLFRSIPLNLSGYLLKPIKYQDLIESLSICEKKLALQELNLIPLKEGWIYNSDLKLLEQYGKSYYLNKKEILFIELIIQNSGRLITKDMIAYYVWEDEEMSDPAITNFILRLRKRFGKTFIHTIPDMGYRFKNF